MSAKLNSMVLWMAVIVLADVGGTAFARADVSLRNGNFYVGFRDISYPGGMEPKIERIYNSQTDYNGIFGSGWGSEYETKLRQDADGSILVTEYGGGADNRFVPKGFKPGDIEGSISKIVEAAKKAGLLSSQKQMDDYRNRMSKDYEFRAKQYSALMQKGFLPKQSIADGSQFISTKYLYQYITKVKGGYLRVKEAGGIQKFNEAGRLVQIMDRNKNFINFTYNSNGHLSQLVDHQNRKMEFKFNAQNLVERITGESGKYVQYRYNPAGFMVYSRDEKGEVNTFAYAADAMKNLTEIGYPGEKNAKGEPSKMSIGYYGRENNWGVKKVINRDGTSNDYEYFRTAKDPNYYGVRVLNKDRDGSTISDAKYEYISKVRAGGEVYTAKMISTVDGDKTETTYDEKLGFPVRIVNDGRETNMQYDQKGRMIKKVTPIETTEMTYDLKVGKISKVVRKMKSGTVLISEFSYDPKSGNLTLAKNNEDKQVKLVYDSQGRIRAMSDKAGRQLTLKYNEQSKPIEIADTKLGVVKFTYKNSGEVDQIQSNGGREVSMQVMQVLQDLVDITAPAGVTMSI